MSDNKYINNVTLECLLNPSLYEKIYNDNKNTQEDITKDILFYRKRLIQLTRNMAKGEYNNSNLKHIFITYATSLIYYLKQEDLKDICQKDYIEINDCNKKFNDLQDNKETIFSNINLDDADSLLINIPKNNNNSLDSFVKKINVNLEQTFLPKKREININDPKLKYKGLKNKSSYSIDDNIKEKNIKTNNIKGKNIKEKNIKEKNIKET